MGCLGYDFGHAGGGIAGGGSRGNLDGLANYTSVAHLCHGKYGSHHSTFVLVAKCNSQKIDESHFETGGKEGGWFGRGILGETVGFLGRICRNSIAWYWSLDRCHGRVLARDAYGIGDLIDFCRCCVGGSHYEYHYAGGSKWWSRGDCNIVGGGRKRVDGWWGVQETRFLGDKPLLGSVHCSRQHVQEQSPLCGQGCLDQAHCRPQGYRRDLPHRY
mmetsp:Transcript_81776/g.229361  ORF Transcript_81776/g.229361 Transcript_81776/m.229361 type:complete len:216 (-) Transcript_81776:986-1633(-)